MKIIVLLGFLGSGKTTCLKHLLTQEESRVACVVNEFGLLDIDSQILETNHTITSVTQGSIFCTCKSDELIEAIAQSVLEKIPTLYIEASGFSNPSTLHHVIQQGLKDMTLDAQVIVVSIIDAYHYLKLSSVLPVLENQVKHAHKIVVNKINLVEADELDALTRKLSEINPDADVVFTNYGQITNKWIQSTTKKQSDQSTFQDKNLAYTTHTLSIQSNIDMNDLMALSKELSGFFIRVKGYIQTNKGSMLLQMINEQMELVPSNDANNKIVVHTLSFQCSIEEIIKLFKKHNIALSILSD